MTIDRADWHYGNDFPTDLPPENGGTHIGMYLAWIINNDLHSLEDEDESLAESWEKVKNRLMTGREFFSLECDDKFWDEDLNDTGLAFTEFYYENYLVDYRATLASELPSTYHVADTWENYDQIAQVIDQRYAQWLEGSK